MMEFKDALRRRRVHLGLTPEQLANLISRFGAPTSAADVQLWERGRNFPPLDNAIFQEALASALQVPVEKVRRTIRLSEREPERPDYCDAAMTAAAMVERMSPQLRVLALEILSAVERSTAFPMYRPPVEDPWQ
jgi:transcriptional regulator with XRE-family HTH domain